MSREWLGISLSCCNFIKNSSPTRISLRPEVIMLCLIKVFDLLGSPPSPPLHPLLFLTRGDCSVGVVHDGLDVVAGEEARGPVHHALVPAVVVLLDHVDDGALLEGKLILLVAGVVVDGHHCRKTRRGTRKRKKKLKMQVSQHSTILLL